MSRIGVLLVLLASLLAGAVAAQTTPGGPDLAAGPLEVVSDMPQWIEGSADPGRIRLQVQNIGTASTAYTITYYWDHVSESTYLNGDQVSSTDVVRDALPPNGVTTHEADWTVQSDQRGASRIIAVLEAAADDDPANDVATASVDVKYHAFGLAWHTQDGSMRPGEARFFRLDVTNEGTTAERLVFPSDSSSDRFQVAFEPAVLDVDAGAIASTYVWATLDSAQGDASLDLQVSARSEEDPRVTEAAPSLLLRRVTTPFLADDFRFEIGLDTPGATDPDRPLAVAVRANNIGRLDDGYRARLELPEGWSAPEPTAWSPLVPGESATWSFVLNAPASVVPGDQVVIKALVESRHLSAPSSKETTVRFDGPAVRIVLAPLDAPSYVNGEASIRLEVRNEGSEPSEGGRIDIRTNPDSAQSRTSIDVGQLRPGESQNLTAAIRWPSTPGQFALGAAWAPADPQAELASSTSLDVAVRRPQLGVTAPGPLTGVPGQTLAYANESRSFTVQNLGTHAETVRLDVLAERGVARLTGPHTLVLQPQERRFVPLEHVLPDPAPAAQARITLKAHIVALPGQVTSAYVDSALVDGRAPVVQLGPVPQLWSASRPVTFRVIAQDDMGLAKTRLWIATPGEARLVGEVLTGETTWTRDVVLRPGEYRAWAEAIDLANRATRSAEWPLRVLDVPAPELLAFSPAEDSVLAPGRVVDAWFANVTTAEAWVDDEPVEAESRLHDNGTLEVRVAWPDLPAGPHRLRVLAKSPDGLHEEADVRFESPALDAGRPEGTEAAGKSAASGLVAAGVAMTFAGLFVASRRVRRP